MRAWCIPIAMSALVVSSCSDGARTDPDRPSADTSTAVAQQISPFPAGESLHSIEVGGLERRFLVHVPADVAEPRAVVFVLHGGGGEGLGVAEDGKSPLSVFRSVADREGFVAIYPEGQPARDRQRLIGWTDCRADNAAASGADDIGFLAALIESVRSAYALPSERIFMAGSSNGAQMSQAFAFHHPEMVGAIASNAGNLPEVPRPGPCTDGPSQPIPILLMIGTADTQMPFAGGCVANLGGACQRGRVISAEETRDRWLDINGLDGVSPTETIIDIEAADAGAAHRFIYGGSAPVEWWRLDGAGHAAASRTVPVKTSRIAGVQNQDVEFAEVAWSFFENMGISSEYR